jgi:hypothetical protein
VPAPGSTWTTSTSSLASLPSLGAPCNCIYSWIDSDCFLTVEGSVPPSWTTRIGAGGALELAPTTWHAEGFWELYYDGDPDARDSVRREVARARGNVLP